MIQLTYKIVEYPLKYPIQTNKGLKESHSSLLLSLDYKRLFRGYGETALLPETKEEIDEMIAVIEKNRRVMESYNMNEPPRFWHFLHHLLPRRNYLISAFDMAGWDMWSKLNARSAAEVMELPKKDFPKTSCSIDSEIPEEIKKIIREHPLWTNFKLNIHNENNIEKAVNAVKDIAPEASIRIDGHESWTLTALKDLLPFLEKENVAYLSQPLYRENTDDLKELRSLTKIPIIADNVIQDEKELLTGLGKYDGATIKPSKCGGITPGLRMIKMIRNAGKLVVLGDTGEGVVGGTATAQMLPYADFADIDSSYQYARTLGNGITIENGDVRLIHGPGFGIQFK